MPNKNKQHWYSFVFQHSSKTSQAYGGLPNKKVTKPDIEKLKRSACINGSAMLMSCSYLGYMSEPEFQGDRVTLPTSLS
ncbi:hypothetical protein [Neptuniibacter sp. QD37_11]|uniref:hypothetical protein n=1 Tax=Neptuniibacter sp. QD37_11 TaxID=3398209 RepID=UPI0039F522DD